MSRFQTPGWLFHPWTRITGTGSAAIIPVLVFHNERMCDPIVSCWSLALEFFLHKRKTPDPYPDITAAP
jgi:hypothetical protein